MYKLASIINPDLDMTIILLKVIAGRWNWMIRKVGR
jgi:hypothetical protein